MKRSVLAPALSMPMTKHTRSAAREWLAGVLDADLVHAAAACVRPFFEYLALMPRSDPDCKPTAASPPI